jgi:hypothetical protein
MRRETSKIMNAFYRGVPAKAARTHTDGQTVWLHNNRIAWRNDQGDICFTLAGWPTTTTRERINGLLSTFGWGRWGVSQRNHEQWLVHHAEKVTEIGDSEIISLSTLRNFEDEYGLTSWTDSKWELIK